MGLIDTLVGNWFRPTVRGKSQIYMYNSPGKRQFVLPGNEDRTGFTIQLFISDRTILPAMLLIYCPNDAGDSGATGMWPVGALVANGHSFDASPICREYKGPVQISWLDPNNAPSEAAVAYVTEWSIRK